MTTPLISKVGVVCFKKVLSPEFGSVLVPFDGSENSIRALRQACTLATRYDSLLTIAYVYSSPVYAIQASMNEPSASLWKPLEDAAKTKAQSVLSKGLAAAKSEGIGAKGELVESQSTVKAILDISEKVRPDLIVVGTRWMSGFKKLMMGSVSNGILGLAECPVLLVR